MFASPTASTAVSHYYLPGDHTHTMASITVVPGARLPITHRSLFIGNGTATHCFRKITQILPCGGLQPIGCFLRTTSLPEVEGWILEVPPGTTATVYRLTRDHRTTDGRSIQIDPRPFDTIRGHTLSSDWLANEARELHRQLLPQYANLFLNSATYFLELRATRQPHAPVTTLLCDLYPLAA